MTAAFGHVSGQALFSYSVQSPLEFSSLTEDEDLDQLRKRYPDVFVSLITSSGQTAGFSYLMESENAAATVAGRCKPSFTVSAGHRRTEHVYLVKGTTTEIGRIRQAIDLQNGPSRTRDFFRLPTSWDDMSLNAALELKYQEPLPVYSPNALLSSIQSLRVRNVVERNPTNLLLNTLRTLLGRIFFVASGGTHVFVSTEDAIAFVERIGDDAWVNISGNVGSSFATGIAIPITEPELADQLRLDSLPTFALRSGNSDLFVYFATEIEATNALAMEWSSRGHVHTKLRLPLSGCLIDEDDLARMEQGRLSLSSPAELCRVIRRSSQANRLPAPSHSR